MYSALTIYATITNEDGCAQDVVVVQNPSISLYRKGKAGDVFVNGFFARVSGATYATSFHPATSLYSNNLYYTNTGAPSGQEYLYYDTYGGRNRYVRAYVESATYYHSSAQWSNDWTQQINESYNSTIQSGSYGTILGSVLSLNQSIDRNFYTTEVSVTSFNTNNDYYIANSQEIHYRIGDPRREASEFYTGASSWDTVTNFYKYLYYSGNTESYNLWIEPGSILITSQLDNERDIIAPSVLVSSALNANSGLAFDTAVKRGATYQEAGYPAGRWRLPSEAEIAFIVARQRDGVIPNLYATDTYYWSGSGRLVYVPADSSAGITFCTPAEAQTTDTTFSCRFVYDLWYWGDEPSTTNVYHPNGHLYNYDASGNATLIR